MVVLVAFVAASTGAASVNAQAWQPVVYKFQEADVSPSDVKPDSPPPKVEEYHSIGEPKAIETTPMQSIPVDPDLTDAPAPIISGMAGGQPPVADYSLGNNCCDNGCGSFCGDCGCGDFGCCGSGCCGSSWLDGVTFGGWINGGYTYNGQGNRAGNGNSPIGFTQISDDFTMNQLWGYIAKEADTGGCGTDWGFRADYVFGTDGPDTQAFGDQGWDFGWNTGGRYGSAIPQLYAEVAYNNWNIKLGRFYTIIGYEVVQATGNFFYSHAYTMLYGEPFTHTGALASGQLNDQVTVHGGYTTGWDTGFNNHIDAHTFLGGITYKMNDCTSIAYACSWGQFGDGSALANGANGAAGDIYMQSVVLQHDLSSNLHYIFQTDYGVNGQVGNGTNEWYGINQYLIYDINDCWGAGIRYEWFDDADGARIAQNGAGAGDYHAITSGLNYKPMDNLTIRPELRWDWFSGAGAPFDPNAAGAGQSNSLFTAGVDFVLTF